MLEFQKHQKWFSKPQGVMACLYNPLWDMEPPKKKKKTKTKQNKNKSLIIR
jgi:hypothetical protein